jgi:hypothetical protein
MLLRSAGLLNDGCTVGGVVSFEGFGPLRVGDWRMAGMCCRLFASRDWVRPDLAGCSLRPATFPSSSVAIAGRGCEAGLPWAWPGFGVWKPMCV